MSYYNSSSSSSSSSHYFGPSSFSSSSSYYNDMHRSYSNLRSLAPSYSQPFYLSSIPSSSSGYATSSSFHKRISPPSSPSILKPKSSPTSSLLMRSATCRLQPPSQTTTEKFTKTTISEIYSKTDEDSDLNSIRLPVSILEPPQPTRKRESSYESIYTNSRASTPAHSSSSSSSSSTNSPSASSTSNHFTDSTNDLQSQQHEPTQPQHQQQSNESNTNDVNATAISSIRLNCTDDLTTQVDYYLNEVDNRMICRGKTIELESFELSGKSGLISKCLYLNDLLVEANMSETNLESDPVFGAGDQGKCTLFFLSVKDSEAFANRHSDKFTVVFTNDVEKTRVSAAITNANAKKNVSFNENEETNESNESNSTSTSNTKKSILKSSNQLSQSKSCDSISSKATIGLGGNHLNSSNSNDNLADPTNVLVSAKQKNKAEGYEILTIRAKLKQRVGQNRTKPVELQDIDSIMRNVVTIIQDEFMKRFPSGPSPNAPSQTPATTAIKQN